VCAGEASGDRLGAQLVKHLRASYDLEVAGLAGPLMRHAGVRAVVNAEDATAFGLVEVVGQLPRLMRVERQLSAEIRTWKPDVVLTIDSPGLLLRVGRRAKAHGLPVIHWVCPQVWAWRPGRVDRMAASMHTLMCLLPFEAPLFDHTDVDAIFVGHPAADRETVEPPERLTFCLAPGSRPGEVRRLWPVCRRIAQRLRVRYPHCRFVVPVAPGVRRVDLGGLDVEFTDGLVGAHAAVVASGTATLELATLGVPMVVIYQVHPLTWSIGRRLVTGVDHVALPNIIARRRIVPEVLQDLNPGQIADEMSALIGESGQRQRSELASIAQTLNGAGAISRAGQIVASHLRR